MGKKIIGVIAFAAIAVAAGWNYQQNQNEVELSDLALANMEALARGEDSTNPNIGTGVKMVDCKNSNGVITGRKCTTQEATPWDTCNYDHQKGDC